MSIKTYSELITLPTFKDRFLYLKLDGRIGEDTFGWDRYLNQKFYTSEEWKTLRNEIIIRDFGCDLGIKGREIFGRITIHHMNPIGKDDIIQRSDYLLNPEFLICVSKETHNAIHYGNDPFFDLNMNERKPNDTCPWRN